MPPFWLVAGQNGGAGRVRRAVVVLDTSGLMTAYGRDQRQQRDVLDVLYRDSGPLVLSPFVLAELYYMVAKRIGSDAELTLLGDVVAGVYRLADCPPTPDTRQALDA